MIQYDMIWYGTIWYDMISHWFTIVETISQLKWGFARDTTCKISAEAGFKNLENFQKISSGNIFLFLDQFRGYFADRYLVVITILWECYSIFHLPLFIFIRNIYYSSKTEPFHTFQQKVTFTLLLSTIVENHCFDNNSFVAYNHML